MCPSLRIDQQRSRQHAIALQDLVRLSAGAPGCGGESLGVFAVKDVAADDLLCRIPKAAVLSTRNSAIADILEEERLGGGLGLTIGAPHRFYAI